MVNNRIWELVSIEMKDGEMDYVVSNGLNEIKGTRKIEKDFGEEELKEYLHKFIDRNNHISVYS